MKKFNKLMVTLASATMLLAGCGQTKDTRTVIEKFADSLKAGNCTIDVDGLWQTYFLGDDAFFYDFSKAYEQDFDKKDVGYLRTEQGSFRFYYGENISIDYCETINANLKISDLTYYPAKLFEDIDAWEQDDEDMNVYTTTDKDIVYYAAFLGGESSLADKIIDNKITLTFPSHKDCSTANIKFSFSEYDVNLDFSDIGNTKDAVVEAYLANPTKMEKITDYPASMKADMVDLLGEALPMYDASYAVTVNDSQRVLTDLGCGNVVSSFGDTLANAGWTLDSHETDNDSTKKVGFESKIYHRDILDNGELVKKQYVQAAWISGDYLDDYYYEKDYYTTYYPQGQFKLSYASEEIYSIARFNTFKNKRATECELEPIVDFTSTEDISFVYTDYSSYAPTLGFYFLDTFSSEYSSAEVALENLQAYATKLENSGFISFDDSKLGTDNSVLYYISNGGYSYFIEIDNKPNTASFSISLYATEPMTTDYGDDTEWSTFVSQFNSIHKDYNMFPELPTTLKEASRVGFSDMTDFYKAEYVYKYEEVYFGYMYALTYETQEEALAAATAISKAFVNSGWDLDPDYTFKGDYENDLYYAGEDKLGAQAVLMLEGKKVMFLVMAYKEF